MGWWGVNCMPNRSGYMRLMFFQTKVNWADNVGKYSAQWRANWKRCQPFSNLLSACKMWTLWMFTYWKDLLGCRQLSKVTPDILFSASKCVIFRLKITKGCHWMPGTANQTVNNIHHPGSGIQMSSVHVNNPDRMFHPHERHDRQIQMEQLSRCHRRVKIQH